MITHVDNILVPEAIRPVSLIRFACQVNDAAGREWVAEDLYVLGKFNYSKIFQANERWSAQQLYGACVAIRATG
jgi:hypothetical protein